MTQTAWTDHLPADYYLFHGGAVSWEGKGVLICAHSSFGKTTLVLELLRRGFSFLSDDLVPISRSSHLIKPFPKSLHVSGDVLALFPKLHPQARKALSVKKKKIIVDIEDIPWGKMGKECPPEHTIFLTPPGGIKAKKRFVELAVSYSSPSFLQELQALKGVKEVSEIGRRDFSLLRLRVDEKSKMIPAIERLCRSSHIPIIYAHRGRAEPMDWDVSPRMRSIPVSQGILELARMLLFSSKSAMLREEFSGSSARLLAEMARFAGQMQFYKMLPGKIRQMGEIVERLVR